MKTKGPSSEAKVKARLRMCPAVEEVGLGRDDVVLLFPSSLWLGQKAAEAIDSVS